MADKGGLMSRLRVPFRMHQSGMLLAALCVLIGIRIGGWQLGLPTGILLIASLLFHELGHMSMAALLKVPVREFGLKLSGAYVKRERSSRRSNEILIAAAGPLMNLLVVFPLIFVPHLGPRLATCNLLLGLTNLLPLPSSDGLRILRNLSGLIVTGDAIHAMSSAQPH